MSKLCDIFTEIAGCNVAENGITSKDPKARYSRIRINLYESFTDKELYLAGSFIGVGSITGRGSLNIKLDYTAAQQINLREVPELKANFTKIYASSDGNGGLCYLYICKYMETSIKPEPKSIFTHTVRSYSWNSTNIVRRIADDYTRYANRVKIRNTHATYALELGYVPYDSIPSTADFRDWSYRLIALDSIEFAQVDLYGLGFVSTVDDASVTLKVIATML